MELNARPRMDIPPRRAQPSPMRDFVKRAFRSVGVEVRRVDPGSSLGLFLVTLIRDLEIDGVLDVGANEGQYGRMLRGEGYEGPMWSFEPGRSAFAALDAGASGNWRALNFALGSSDGELGLNVPAGGTDVASFRTPVSGALEAIGAVGVGSTTESVPVRRLDAVLPALTDARRLLLKLDTQGFDLEVVRGATGVLDRVVAIQTELSFQQLYEGQPGWRETLDELGALGFVPADFFPNVRGKGWSLVEADCVLVRSPTA